MDLGLVRDRPDGQFLAEAWVEDSEERIEQEDVLRSQVSSVFKERVRLLYTETYEAARRMAMD
jgi:hypothetical protein